MSMIFAIVYRSWNLKLQKQLDVKNLPFKFFIKEISSQVSFFSVKGSKECFYFSLSQSLHFRIIFFHLRIEIQDGVCKTYCDFPTQCVLTWQLFCTHVKTFLIIFRRVEVTFIPLFSIPKEKYKQRTQKQRSKQLYGKMLNWLAVLATKCMQ